MSKSKGGYKLEWHGEAVKATARSAALEGLKDCGYAVLADSSNLVPHDTGELEGAGDLVVNEQKLEVQIVYDKPHAIRQHEDTTLRHPNGRSAKYVEKPLKDRGMELDQYVADKVRAALK